MLFAAVHESGVGVRREKAALLWLQVLPGERSSRSSYGGDEVAEAFGMRVTNW
jgi:hypothetical protein